MKLRLWLVLTTAAAGLVVFAMAMLFFYLYEQRSSEQLVVQAVHTAMNAGGRVACEASPETWFAEYFGEDSWPGIVPPGPAPRDRGQLSFLGRAGRGARLPMHAQVFAYDARLKSANPLAPALHEHLRKDWEHGQIGHVSSVGGTLEFLDDGGRSCGPGTVGRQAPAQGPGPGCPPGGMAKRPGEMRIHQILIPMAWKDGPCAAVLVRYDEPAEEVVFHRFSPPLGVWGLPVLVMLLTVLLAAGPIVRRIRRLTSQVRRSAADRYRTPIGLRGRDEIGQLGAAFEDARAEILEQVAQQEEREQNLRTFLENTTHDISIPLTVLQGHLADMAGRGGQMDPETVGGAMAEANYLAALIGNLSVASRLETGQPTMQQEPVNLNDLVGRCVIRHRPIARQRSVSLDHAIPEQPLFTRGDVTFLEQAVNNVIFNAIRHNRRDGHVAVILEATAGDRFQVSVIDDGPGIADEEMARIAERYYRCGKERGREAGNQGIGLNIASRIAGMHGWEFKLSRSEFGGLRVDFEGPALSPGFTPRA